MFISSPEYADSINELLTEYKKVKPNVTINYETTQNDYPTMLKAKLNSGECPDIFSSTAGKEIETYKEYSYDLSGQPETGLGIIPGFGGTQRLPRLVGKAKGKLMIMTGEIIGAQEAYEIGLVEKVVPADELMNAAEELANTIKSKAPIAVAVTKTVVNNGYGLDMKTASALEMEAFTAPFASQDKSEGMLAFLEKRTPEFKNK